MQLPPEPAAGHRVAGFVSAEDIPFEQAAELWTRKVPGSPLPTLGALDGATFGWFHIDGGMKRGWKVVEGTAKRREGKTAKLTRLAKGQKQLEQFKKDFAEGKKEEAKQLQQEQARRKKAGCINIASPAAGWTAKDVRVGQDYIDHQGRAVRVTRTAEQGHVLVDPWMHSASRPPSDAQVRQPCTRHITSALTGCPLCVAQLVNMPLGNLKDWMPPTYGPHTATLLYQ